MEMNGEPSSNAGPGSDYQQEPRLAIVDEARRRGKDRRRALSHSGPSLRAIAASRRSPEINSAGSKSEASRKPHEPRNDGINAAYEWTSAKAVASVRRDAALLFVVGAGELH